jgi:hypothetical protein
MARRRSISGKGAFALWRESLFLKSLDIPPIEQSPATRRPDFFGDGSQYEGHDIRLAKMDCIWSIGRTPEDAVDALCKARFGTPLEGSLRPIGGVEDPTSPYTWGCRFTSGGTHFKAAGIHVPGGVIVTWWV